MVISLCCTANEKLHFFLLVSWLWRYFLQQYLSVFFVLIFVHYGVTMLKKIKAAGAIITAGVKHHAKLAAARHVVKRAEPGSERHDRAAEGIFAAALGAKPKKQAALVREYLGHFDAGLAARFAPSPQPPKHMPKAVAQDHTNRPA
jgi:hypothetical protein